MEELIKLLWNASENRKVCRISLKGEPFPRVVHPFGVCQSSNKKVILVCELIAGYTKGGGKAGYRNLSFEKVLKVEILDQFFGYPKDFNPKDSQYGDWVFHI